MSGPPVVLLGGDSNALSAARSLAAAGVEVHAVGPAEAPVRYSRALRSFTPLQTGSGAPERWLRWLLERRLQAVLIACADDGIELLARHGETLAEAGYVLPEMDAELALALLDKERSLRLAHEAGVPAPRVVSSEELEDVARAVDQVGLPCVLKPRRQVLDMPPGFAGKAFQVDDAKEFARISGGLRAHGIDLVAMELVPGSDDHLVQYWSYVSRDGELLLELTKRKVRQQPPGYGTGCYQAIDWDEEVAAAGRRFARGLGLVGYSSVEFKRRPADGELVLIECNYRLIDANEAGRVAGLDVARVVYERALGRDVPVQPRPRDGVRFWHPVRDARAALEYRRRGELSGRAYLRGIMYRQVTPYFSWQDLRPSLMVAATRISRRLPWRRG